ncbi:hypothetical protein ACWIUA_10285 [Ursidibacter sp. B-7004-1]
MELIVLFFLAPPGLGVALGLVISAVIIGGWLIAVGAVLLFRLLPYLIVLLVILLLPGFIMEFPVIVGAVVGIAALSVIGLVIFSLYTEKSKTEKTHNINTIYENAEKRLL